MWAVLLVVMLLGALAAPEGSDPRPAIDRRAALAGRVVLRGETPPPAHLPVLKNADVCGDRLPDQSLLVSPAGGVANALIELEGMSPGGLVQRPPAGLDNRGCAFVPRVQALVVGQALEIRNSDPLLHDAHAWLGSRTIFNLGLPEWRRVTHVFETPGLHEIDCNVLHTWMKAWIFVSEHPHVAVTGADGRFSLPDVPIGHHSLRVWHEILGERRITVEVPGPADLEIEMALPAPSPDR